MAFRRHRSVAILEQPGKEQELGIGRLKRVGLLYGVVVLQSTGLGAVTSYGELDHGPDSSGADLNARLSRSVTQSLSSDLRRARPSSRPGRRRPPAAPPNAWSRLADPSALPPSCLGSCFRSVHSVEYRHQTTTPNSPTVLHHPCPSARHHPTTDRKTSPISCPLTNRLVTLLAAIASACVGPSPPACFVCWFCPPRTATISPCLAAPPIATQS